jgi:mRNA interferase MazF
MQKDFDKWNEIKKETDRKILPEEFFFYKREIWWCSIGVNVGREQDGHGDDFERPVLIFRVLSPDTFIAMPLSTKKRLEKFQAVVSHGHVRGFALLDQIRVFDAKRLRRKVGTINSDEFAVIKEKLRTII